MDRTGRDVIAMKCPRCQSDNREGARFCLECGEELGRLCPRCGKAVALQAKFCDECGHNLGKPGEGPLVSYSQPRSYTPRFLADKILTARSSIEGERKLVTVLFADVVNYTAISDKLDSEEVRQILDGCLRILMNEIHRYEGTIDKFTGDGIMALFGAPVAHEDHAQRACYAALAIQRAIDEYGARIEKEYGLEFRMRVGLNSGPVIVGSIGNDLRMEYTAIGGTVNLASRMQSMAEPGTVQVAEETYRLAREYFNFRPLGGVEVKGKKGQVRAFQVLDVGLAKDRLRAAMARGLSTFVGRTRELTHLTDCFLQAKDGRGQVVGIVGEAGVGKSRILLEWKGMLSREAFTYLEGSCLHHGDATAYLPIVSLLRSYFDIREGEQEPVIKQKIVDEQIVQVDEKLKGILPALHDVLSLGVEDEGYLKLEPQQRRERIFEAIRNLLVRESQNRPLVLAVEDLHWVDNTSEEFLSYLIAGLPNARILLLLIYRPEYTHSWGSKSYYSQIGVDELSTSASVELVQSILKGGEVTPELRELVRNTGAGNPLFIEELTNALVENGSIQKKDHRYVLTTEVSDIRVPDTIEGIIAARMDRLEEDLKRTMQTASVIGRGFGLRVLRKITGIEELSSHLFALQTLEFIYENSLFPEPEYVFKHALTQEVAYNSLLLKRRKDIHERIGQAIEELYPDRLEEFYETLAHHYVRSDNPEKAYQYLKLSAHKATLGYSNWEAFRFYKQAIGVVNKLPETEENKRKAIEVRLLMGGPIRLLAHPQDSLQVLQEGERLARELGDEKSLATFYSIMRGYYSVRGQPLEGMKYAEDSFRAAMNAQDIDLAAPIAYELCVSYGTMGEFLKVAEVAPKVIALLEKTGRESDFYVSPFNVYSALLALHGLAMGWTGDFDQGQTLCEKALHFALQIDDLYSAGWAEVMYSYLLIGRGDGKNAVTHAARGVDLCEQGQLVVILGVAWATLGEAYRLVGELEMARKHAERSLDIESHAGLSLILSQSHCSLGMIYADSGDAENAQTCIESALKSSRSNNERWVEGRSRLALGRLLGKAEAPQRDKAEEHLLEGIKILDRLRLKPFCSEGYLYLGQLYGGTGQREKALESLEKAEEMFREMGMDYWMRRARSALDELEG